MLQPVVPTTKRGFAVSKTAGAETPTALLGATRSMSEYEPEDDSSGVECPHCGAVCKNDSGVKIHIGQTHPEKSEAHGEFECDQCGDTFRRLKVDVNGERKFCGRECLGDWRSENRAGEDSSHYNRTTVQCTYCGTDLSRIPAQAEQGDRNFCDHECQARYRSENMVGEDHPLHDRVTVQCTYCKTAIPRKPSAAEKNDRHFCNHDCYKNWRAANLNGENSWTWKGGPAPYGKGWNKAKREQIRKRDDRKCQACGKTEAKHLSEHGKKLDVHHIQKARDFDDPAKRNDPSNLVTLCTGCHNQWEGIPLQPQVLQ